VPATVTGRLWAAFLAASLLTFVVAAPGDAARQSLLCAFLGLASVAAVVVAVEAYQPRPTRPWWLLAAGQLCFAIGDLAAVVSDSPVHAAGFPTIGQILYLAGYPIVTLGFTLLVVRRPLGAGWAVLLDGGILTAGIAVFAWVAFGDPIMSQGLSSVDQTVQVSYLLCDIALVGVVACLLLGSETGTTSIRLFVASVIALLVGDGLARAGGPWDGSIWSAGAAAMHYGLWGAGALHPSMSRPARLNVEKAHRMTPVRVTTLVGAGMVAPVILAVQGMAGSAPDWAAISLGGVVIVFLAIISMADMVTEQTAAAEKQLVLEERFRQTSETLRAILDSSPLAIVVTDRHRRVLFWSRAAEQLFGYKAQEVLGHRSPVVPADAVEGRALMPRVLAGASVVEQDLPSKTKDGRPMNVRAHFAPIADDAGHILGAISLMEDTSEIDRLQAELFEASKLESVGRLAGGIAHDFNNILTAIIGFAELSIDEPPGTDLTEYVTGIRDAAERAAGLTQQLLAFSRRQMLAPQVLAINEVCSGVESMLRRLITEQIELRIALDPDAGYVRVDRTQLEQVILNLTLNSRDAMPSGGRLVVETGHVHYSNVSRTRPRDLVAGDYVTISVSDTGVGMDPDTRDHIFEPFYTTKPGKGTGLGLATTYGIIKQSGGSVFVESERGQGTCFRIFFPTVMREAMPIHEPGIRGEGAATSAARSGRILLVEDEEGLRGIAKRVLDRAGFEVIAADGPDEAILAFESMTAPIDLLVTDVVMPEMRGPELAARLRQRQPGLKVLLVSGYAQEIVEVGRDDSVPFLAKPFSVESLLTAVDAAMNREDGLGYGEPVSAPTRGAKDRSAASEIGSRTGSTNA
jgi:PAS domain S-box-containing protein